MPYGPQFPRAAQPKGPSIQGGRPLGQQIMPMRSPWGGSGLGEPMDLLHGRGIPQPPFPVKPLDPGTFTPGPGHPGFPRPPQPAGGDQSSGRQSLLEAYRSGAFGIDNAAFAQLKAFRQSMGKAGDEPSMIPAGIRQLLDSIPEPYRQALLARFNRRMG